MHQAHFVNYKSVFFKLHFWPVECQRDSDVSSDYYNLHSLPTICCLNQTQSRENTIQNTWQILLACVFWSPPTPYQKRLNHTAYSMCGLNNPNPKVAKSCTEMPSGLQRNECVCSYCKSMVSYIFLRICFNYGLFKVNELQEESVLIPTCMRKCDWKLSRLTISWLSNDTERKWASEQDGFTITHWLK